MKNAIVMFRVVAAAVVLGVVTPSIGEAQEIATAAAVTVFRAPAAPAAISMNGPVVVQAGIVRSDVAPELALHRQAPAARRDVAWMVIGGATLVVGSLVGGDAGTILMVTGGVVGLMGLWRYLQ